MRKKIVYIFNFHVNISVFICNNYILKFVNRQVLPMQQIQLEGFVFYTNVHNISMQLSVPIKLYTKQPTKREKKKKFIMKHILRSQNDTLLYGNAVSISIGLTFIFKWIEMFSSSLIKLHSVFAYRIAMFS